MTKTMQQLRTDVDGLRDDLNTEKELRESAMQAQTTIMREESLGLKFELSKQLKNNTESVESVRLPAARCMRRKAATPLTLGREGAGGTIHRHASDGAGGEARGAYTAAGGGGPGAAHADHGYQGRCAGADDGGGWHAARRVEGGEPRSQRTV